MSTLIQISIFTFLIGLVTGIAGGASWYVQSDKEWCKDLEIKQRARIYQALVKNHAKEPERSLVLMDINTSMIKRCDEIFTTVFLHHSSVFDQIVLTGKNKGFSSVDYKQAVKNIPCGRGLKISLSRKEKQLQEKVNR